MKIKIEINLGNDTMKEPEDVERLLQRLALSVGNKGFLNRKLYDSN